jgi:hypothetical protein
VTDPVLKAILLAIAAAMAIHLIKRSPQTIQWPAAYKAAAMLAVLVLVAFVGRPVLVEIWHTVTGGGPDLDRKISFNCYNSVRPTHFREDRPLYIVQIVQPPEYGPAHIAVANTFFAQGTNEISWGDNFRGFFKKCTLANYSSEALFKVSVPLFVEWMASISGENGSTSAGDIIKSGEVPSPSFDLGLGTKNEDYFYIFNNSDLYVKIRLPETASIYLAGAAYNAKLIPPTAPFPEIILFPRQRPTIATNPPDAGLPIPMPPSRPKGK